MFLILWWMPKAGPSGNWSSKRVSGLQTGRCGYPLAKLTGYAMTASANINGEVGRPLDCSWNNSWTY